MNHTYVHIVSHMLGLLAVPTTAAPTTAAPTAVPDMLSVNEELACNYFVTSDPKFAWLAALPPPDGEGNSEAEVCGSM